MKNTVGIDGGRCGNRNSTESENKVIKYVDKMDLGTGDPLSFRKYQVILRF